LAAKLVPRKGGKKRSKRGGEGLTRHQPSKIILGVPGRRVRVGAGLTGLSMTTMTRGEGHGAEARAGPEAEASLYLVSSLVRRRSKTKAAIWKEDILCSVDDKWVIAPFCFHLSS